jgi:hypothetical protein
MTAPVPLTQSPECTLSEEANPAERAKWVEDRRQYVIQTSATLPSEPVAFLFAVHEVWKWIFALPELKAHIAVADFQYLCEIVDKCSGLPLSTEWQHWAVESLREKDLIACSIEERVREDVLSAFARISNDLERML